MAAEHDLVTARRDLAIRSANQQAEVEAVLAAKADPLQQLREQLLAAEASMGGSAAMKQHLQKQAAGSQSPSPRISTSVHHPLQMGNALPPNHSLPPNPICAADSAGSHSPIHPLAMQPGNGVTAGKGTSSVGVPEALSAVPTSAPIDPLLPQKSPQRYTSPMRSPYTPTASTPAAISPHAGPTAAQSPLLQSGGAKLVSPSETHSSGPMHSKGPASEAKRFLSPSRARSPFRRGVPTALASPAAAPTATPKGGASPSMLAKPASRILSPVRTLKALVSGSKNHASTSAHPQSGFASPHKHPQPTSHGGLQTAHYQAGLENPQADVPQLTSPTARQPYTSMLAAGTNPLDPGEEWLVSPHASFAALNVTLSSAHAASTTTAGGSSQGMSPGKASWSDGISAVGGMRHTASPMKGRLVVDLPSGLHDPTPSATPVCAASARSPHACTQGETTHSCDIHAHTPGMLSSPHQGTPSAAPQGGFRPESLSLKTQTASQPPSGPGSAAAGAASLAARPSSAISRMRARTMATTASRSIGTSSESSTPRASPTGGLQHVGQNLASPLVALSGGSNGGASWRSADRSSGKGLRWDKENLAPDSVHASDDSVNLATSPYGQA